MNAQKYFLAVCTSLASGHGPWFVSAIPSRRHATSFNSCVRLDVLWTLFVVLLSVWVIGNLLGVGEWIHLVLVAAVLALILESRRM